MHLITSQAFGILRVIPVSYTHLDVYKRQEFAEVIEKIDNLRGALEIPMPAGFHVNQMKRELEEVSDKLKRIYVEEEDENPWEE